MKRFIYIILAALAMFTACEATVQPQENQTMTFTASLDPASKTHIMWSDEQQVFKTVWTENDRILVYDNNHQYWSEFYIVDGVGTTSATFMGYIATQDTYYAVYSPTYGVSGEPKDLEIPISYTQYPERNIIGEPTFASGSSPMAARSNSTELHFKNLCSVLWFSLTGNGENVENVEFSSHSNDLASSSMTFDITGDEPVINQIFKYGNSSRDLYCWCSLSSTPSDHFMVIPSGNYYDGFDIRLNTDKGTIVKSTYDEIVFERSQVRKVNIEFNEDDLATWGLVGDFNNWGSASADIPLTEYYILDNTIYLVLKNQWLEAGSEFKIRFGREWEQNYGGYYIDDIAIDTPTLLSYGGNNMRVTESGTYDIYFGLENETLFVMNVGICPEGKVEAPDSVWSLIGSMSEWSEDYVMNNEGGIWTLYQIYLNEGDQFKFRASYSWGINLGVGGVLPVNGEMVGLYQGGENIVVGTTGHYNLYLDPDNGTLRTEYLGY